jgi:ribosomal peptide maturation radical SAM protein 1
MDEGLRSLLRRAVHPNDELLTRPPLAPSTAEGTKAHAPPPELPPGPLSTAHDSCGQILIVVPPFASLWYPSLGAHVLQACARERGYVVDVLYANLLLAKVIGEPAYEQICNNSMSLAAERFFARAAFDLPPLGHSADELFEPERIYGVEKGQLCRGLYPDGSSASLGDAASISVSELKRLEEIAPQWIARLAAEVASRGYTIVGATTTFQQTTASVAFLNEVKRLAPSTVTILGGANCEGEMAEGILSLKAGIDYVFAGESEETFTAFVDDIMKGRRPEARVVQGRPCENMDALPMIRSREFFDQRASYLPRSVPPSSTFISLETSRGCWWGQKQHCTFCGLNGEGMGFRRKSPDRAIAEIQQVLDESPTRNIIMTDNIMPRDYFKTVVPRLESEAPAASIFYEQKANMSFAEMQALAKAGIRIIQPGIEALNTDLLKLMRKGVHARQNVTLLRHARIVGIRTVWNLICAFPNDQLSSYVETRELVPLIRHLEPPNGVIHLSIERFSPYFTQPKAFGVENVRPMPVYADFLPAHADIEKIAYHFIADYPSETHRYLEEVRALYKVVDEWIDAWRKPYTSRPEFKIVSCDQKHYLFDTRGVPATEELQVIDRRTAVLLSAPGPYTATEEQVRAISRGWAALIDQWFVPLPVASEDLFVDILEADREEDHEESRLIRLRKRPLVASVRGA